MKQKVRIVIADSHPILRDGLRRLLTTETDFEVVGEAVDGPEAVKLARQLWPDILTIELSMPKQGGLDVLRQLSSHANPVPVRVILLTAAISKSQLVEALQLGGRGIVLKDSATHLLNQAIRTVMAGEYWVGREGISNLGEYLRMLEQSTLDEAQRKKFGLTPRELEIIAALEQGYSNKEIAEYFKISEDSVRHHLSDIVDKLGVRNRLEFALRSKDGLWATIRRRIEAIRRMIWEMDPDDRVRTVIFTSALATGTMLVLIAVIQGLRQ